MKIHKPVCSKEEILGKVRLSSQILLILYADRDRNDQGDLRWISNEVSMAYTYSSHVCHLSF